MSNLISLFLSKTCRSKVVKTRQSARQLDVSFLKVCDEVKTTLFYGPMQLHLNTLVVDFKPAEV